MSSLLTPKRRERAKKKSKAAHSMSPSIRPSYSSSSSIASRPGRYQAMTDDESSSRNGNGFRRHNQNAAGSGGGSNCVPRTVTPTGSAASNSSFDRHQRQSSRSHAFEDSDERHYVRSSCSTQGISHGKSAMSFENNVHPVLVVSTTPLSTSSSRIDLDHTSIDEDDNENEPFDEDMPMDERLDRKHHHRLQPGLLQSNSTDLESTASATYRSTTPTKEIPDVVSMLSSSHDGGDASGMGRMISALSNGSRTRPPDLNREERFLWDAIQSAMINDRNDYFSKRRTLERQLQEATAKLGQVTARETELELELTKSKCECADVEYKYAMALAENRVLVGQRKKSNTGTTIETDSGTGESFVNLSSRVESLQAKLKEKDDELEKQRNDHEAEVRAIQRVLADLMAEQEENVESSNPSMKTVEDSTSKVCVDETGLQTDSEATYLALKNELKISKNQLDSVKEEKTALHAEIESTKENAVNLLKEVGKLQTKIKVVESEMTTHKVENEKLRDEIKRLTLLSIENISDDRQDELSKPEVDHPKPEDVSDEAKDDEILHPVSFPQDDELKTLKKKLEETESSLENAKKIIGSLESANGSLALDLRAKLKAKEEELSNAHRESDERKRRLDSLATELRDLQRKQGDVESKSRKVKSQLMKQKSLVVHLRTSMADLQAAIVVHEASISVESGVADRESIEEISDILADTLSAVKETLESTEELMNVEDDESVVHTDIELNSEVGRHIDAIVRNDREAAAKDLRSQLDQKKIAVKRLEEALKKQNEEMKRMRIQLDSWNRGQGESDDQLRAEIQSLRQQCSANMEVLAKKERELSVLRSSLKVDDNDAGYISDDNSDDEAEGNGENSIPSPCDLDSYGPVQAEAIATLLSQTGGRLDLPGPKREVDTLKTQLMKALSEKEAADKELRTERESLTNAKMIISSLEKANKGMMEDLRSRLQDSNTAIASLLDKSMDHEKNAEKYQLELENLKEQRRKEKEDYEAKVKRLEEILMSQYGAQVPLNKGDIPTEEKKIMVADI